MVDQALCSERVGIGERAPCPWTTTPRCILPVLLPPQHLCTATPGLLLFVNEALPRRWSPPRATPSPSCPLPLLRLLPWTPFCFSLTTERFDLPRFEDVHSPVNGNCCGRHPVPPRPGPDSPPLHPSAPAATTTDAAMMTDAATTAAILAATMAAAIPTATAAATMTVAATTTATAAATTTEAATATATTATAAAAPSTTAAARARRWTFATRTPTPTARPATT